ncbi:MAG TPA: DUF1028 domain-containing protein [Stellaceae bacterium]|jgi:uncharacterized Ntn-hydrolase superfamily protein|nr:DUF1028 domain-containing protein [Stellaceae bacterium]
MTFSIVARCPRTRRFAVAVSSSFPAAAAHGAFVRAGIGAVATQHLTDPSLGAKALDLLAQGMLPLAVLAELRKTVPQVEYRQLILIDRTGNTAGFSGKEVWGVSGMARGTDVVSAGSMLANAQVPEMMAKAFEAMPHADLGDRIVAAMEAGLDTGGEAGALRSAGLLIVDKESWAVADLRIDWHDNPIGELAALWRLWRQQQDAFITRALDPASVPRHDAPEDE